MSIAIETEIETAGKHPSSARFKVVPESRALRDRIRTQAAQLTMTLDRSRPLTRQELQQKGEGLLKEMGLSEQYLGFTMVAISNGFWREQFQAVDCKRRLLLLPHCLKHPERCAANYDEFGLDCTKCCDCAVADFKIRAENLGYKVLVSEGTPVVLNIIVSGQVDAIVGVACLNVLEKAFDKVLLAGIPCMAAPLLSSKCRNTSVDHDWVMELIDLGSEMEMGTSFISATDMRCAEMKNVPISPVSAAKTRTYVHLMRAAHQLCEEPELSRLAPRTRAKPAAGPNGRAALDPFVSHENIAYDWLAQGGKHFRPFITLAVYDALRGAPGTHSAESLTLPDHVRRTALAIETFHKASLVHDDIEDDDSFRYGRQTLHRQHGVSTAINLGDYLIGMGYHLISYERRELGGDATADILNRLAEAHQRLSEGQGAELLWRDAAQKSLTPLEALKIYALKTAPAFGASPLCRPAPGGTG